MSYQKDKQYRLPHYDYSKPGEYFVTINAYAREMIFGEISDETMHYSKIGMIVKETWLSIPRQFPNIRLNAWVIMPNHVHGIIKIQYRDMIQKRLCKNVINHVPTKNHIDHIPKGTMNTRHLTLGYIIRWFKARSTHRIHEKSLMQGSLWQSRFYDHVIRSEESIDAIREYIKLNPMMWEDTN